MSSEGSIYRGESIAALERSDLQERDSERHREPHGETQRETQGERDRGS